MKINPLFFAICLSLIVSGTASFWFCDSTDPCHAANTSEPFEPDFRAENCQYVNHASRQLCDRYITPGWYRFAQDMLNHPPMLLSCAAVYPSWLNGTLPTVEGEEVERTVCKVGFRDSCVRKVAIKIKHCGSFKAYCLPALDSCSERFCFGESDAACEATTPAQPPAPTATVNVYTTEAVTQPPAPTTTADVNTTPAVTQTPAPTKRPHPKTTTQFPFVSQFCSSDPCSANNLPNILNPMDRSENCKYTSLLQSCDRDLSPGWYRAEGKEKTLLNTCPGALSCGAIHPVWMNGSHPKENDGLVRREICTAGFRGRNECCLQRENIFVKNCGGYMAYCLWPLKKCEERYCFGKHADCSEYTDDADRIILQQYKPERKLSHNSVVVIAIVAVILISLSIITLLILRRKTVLNSCTWDDHFSRLSEKCGCTPSHKKGLVPLSESTVSTKISYA
ncbi:uncharacterized protein LOC125667484 isoform X1 [Ostrea edulis]|uniref:uncharacterized protein LOC125667484 isoform X1 n=1 Tax=Ostrea edulis TaxID=37623 RepID=UPI0024AF0FCB|nr:uncharacterized protein LOC125667484 isoform X1 [Ostrea edulis]